MESHNKKLDPKEITTNGAIDDFYDGIKEIQARVYRDAAINCIPKMAIMPTCMPNKETNYFVEKWKDGFDKLETKETVWDKISEIQAKHIQKYKETQEKAITQAILSCSYQYDEVLQYLKNRQRFEIKRLQFGDMLNGHTECVLYDSYMQKAFILTTESRSMNIEDFDGTSTLNIESHRNRQVPYNYHR